MNIQPFSQEEHGQAHPQPGPEVNVTVDNKPMSVHRGHYIVSEFKVKVQVDSALALDEVVNNELKELNDTDNVVIKGGETFISHVRRGGSS